MKITHQTDTCAAILTLSLSIPLKLYTLPYWSNPPFLIFDIRALWRSALSARAPECQKIKNGGLDQHGAEPFEQQQFGTAGGEWVNPKTRCVTKLLFVLIRCCVSVEFIIRPNCNFFFILCS